MINNNEYNQTELQSFVSIIHSNVIGALRGGIRFAEEELGIKWKESILPSINFLKDLESVVLTEEVGDHCARVWDSSDFQMYAMRYTVMSRTPSEMNLSSRVSTASGSDKITESGEKAKDASTTSAAAEEVPSTEVEGISIATTSDATTTSSAAAAPSSIASDHIEDEVSSEEERIKWTMEDGAIYFMNHLGRISASKYVPTSQDILHARQKSTGIIETQFESNNAIFRIVDVGGQRSERKKWSMLFSDITGIIFCADVSCYDTPLREDPDVNRMIDSLNTFQQICNNRDLHSRDIILFLNKTDLLAKKIKRSSIPSDLFPGAPSGPNVSAEDALKFIQSLYLSKNAHPTKFIYAHQTVATDTSSIKAAFTEIVKEIVRKDNVLASF